MKTIHKFITLFVLISSSTCLSQETNWRTLSGETRHLVSGHFGADYSSFYGFSYGYCANKNHFPVVVGNEFSLAFGKDILDDWKSKTTIQLELWHQDHLSFSVKGGFIMRKYESQVAQLYNIATDFTTQFGYAGPKWGVSATFNYDRNLATNIRHGLLKEYYPEIRDGWYGFSGGNFKFGIRGSRSIHDWNVYFNMGKMYGQDLQSNPTLPFFAELSVQKQF